MTASLPLLLALAVTAADEPDIDFSVQGNTVVATTVVATTPERVREALSDPGFEGRVTGNRSEFTLEGTEAGCQHVAYVVPNIVKTTRYRAKRCPTSDGWTASLLSSDDFSTYESRWRAVPEGEGTRITYTVDMVVTLWVPNSLVRGETRKSVRKMLKGVQDWAATKPGAAAP